MMDIIGRRILVFVASTFGVTAIAADFDGSEPLTCSLGQVVECDAGSACRAVTHESVDAPDFLKVNFRRNEVTPTVAGEDGLPGGIDNIVDLDNNIVLQGIQGGTDGIRDTLAWSMSISHETGAMVLTGSGENAGFVVFGACTP